MDGSVVQPGYFHPTVFVSQHFTVTTLHGTPLRTHQPAITIHIPVGGARFQMSVRLHSTSLKIVFSLSSTCSLAWSQVIIKSSGLHLQWWGSMCYKGHNIFWTFPKCQSYRSSILRARRCVLWLRIYTMRCWWITPGSGIIFIINYFFVIIMGHSEDKAMQLS